MAETKAKELAKLASLSPTKGRLLVGDGSDWVSVDPGTDGYVLTADSTDAEGFVWAVPISVGYGQTWQDMSGSRAQSTSAPSPGSVYQNTTGKPIVVCVWDTTNENIYDAYCDTAATPTTKVGSMRHVSSNSNQDNSVSVLTFIVPDQSYYFIHANDVNEGGWVELR